MMLGKAIRCINHFLLLHKYTSIVRNCNALPALSYIIVLIAAGIEYVQPSVMFNTAPGVDSMAVLLPVRYQSRSLTFPVDHIFRSKQPPFLIGMVKPKTIPLMEKIVGVLKLDETVRIIQKSPWRLDVV